MIKLKNIRKSKGFTQDVFAEMIGISVQGYRNYELGKRDIPFSLIMTMCHVLGCNLSELIEGYEKTIEDFTTKELMDELQKRMLSSMKEGDAK